jgi:hypothetical protein
MINTLVAALIVAVCATGGVATAHPNTRCGA